MAKNAYIGVRGKARKISKMYFGVAGKARLITNAYIGIGGKARPWYSLDSKPAYYGTITSLSVARDGANGGSIGNYALFFGGNNGKSLKTVDAYNSSLSRSNGPAMPISAHEPIVTSNSKYLIVSKYDGVYALDSSLTWNTPEKRNESSYDNEGTSIGDYAVLGPGQNNGATSGVDAYNSSLTHTVPDPFSVGRFWYGAASIGDYALFAGGYSSSTSKYYNTIDAYSSSLTHSTPVTLSKNLSRISATSITDYAIFASSKVINAFDKSLTRTLPPSFGVSRPFATAISIGGFAVFAGGGTNPEYANVDSYSSDLTKVYAKNLSQARTYIGAATVGNYAIFAGGGNYNSNTGWSYQSTAEAYSAT